MLNTDSLPTAVKGYHARPMVALLDIDGVVYDFVSNLARVATARTGRPMQDFKPAECWDFFLDWGLTLPEFLELYAHGVHHHGLMGKGLPLPGAVAGWSKLHASGAAIVIATDCGAPGAEEEARAARRTWLEEWGFTHHQLVFTAEKHAVAETLIEGGFAVCAIEDRPKNFDALLDAGADAYLMHQRWNRLHPDHGRRVLDLEQFADRVLSSTR